MIPQEEIAKHREELDQMIINLGKQMTNIKMADDIIMSLEDPMLQKQYAYEMLDMVGEYKQECNNVLLKLEEYRQIEKEAKLPTDFIYYKLIRQLQKD